MAVLIAIAPLLWLWVFWYLYVLVMGLYRAYLDKRLTKFTLVMAAPALFLGYTAGIAFTAQLSGDTATTTTFVAVRQELLDITKGLTDPAEVEDAVASRYAALVPKCTPAMVSAFAQVDA